MKPRVIRQLSASDCGAASLAMILRHFGHEVSLNEMRSELPSTRDGVTAATLVKSGELRGLVGRGFLLRDDEVLDEVPLPAIAHWEGDHFVVLESVDIDGVVVADPARGRLHFERSDFVAGFSGVVLTFEPGPGFLKRKAPREHIWRRYLSSLKGTPGVWRAAGILVLLGAVGQTLSLVLPLSTFLIVDRVLGADRPDLLVTTALIGAGAIVGDLVFRIVRGFVLMYARTAADRVLQGGFVEHTFSLDLDFFGRYSTGDLLLRVSSLAAIRTLFTDQLVLSFIDAVFFLGYVAFLWFAAPPIMVVVLVSAGLQLVILAAMGPALNRRRLWEIEHEAREGSHLVQALRGVSTIKALGAEDQITRHWRALFEKYLRVSIDRSKLSVVQDALSSAIRSGSVLAFLVVGARLVQSESLTLGEMLAVAAVAGASLGPVQALMSSAQQFVLATAHVQRVLDIYDQAPDSLTDEPATVGEQTMHAPLHGRLAFDGVGYSFNGDEKMALADISFEVEPGKRLAIVGPSGAGKSTLLRLALGLLAPSEGQVLVDGSPIGSLDNAQLRSQMAVVLQEPFVIGGRLRDNITVGLEDVPEDALVEAARAAGLLDDVLAMPLGFDTVITESGAGLSGGQLQRLSLTRALVRQPKILLLDEATSHLDNTTESMISAAMDELDCTRVIVAHRLSTIRNADEILVLNEGRIVERGTHETLIGSGGLYSRLYGAGV